MQQHSTVGAAWALLMLLMAASAASSPALNPQQDVVCPFEYRRHSLEDFSDESVKPYLFGGIYNSDRECVNCKRGGLWSDFCGFRVTDKMEDVPFWSNQLCNATTIDAAIKRTMQMDNAADVLGMTPCDLWYYLRGRTTWIIGDSMSKDLYKALKCFMVEFTDLNTYHASNNFTAMHYLDSLPGFGEPHCIHMPHHTRLCQVHAIQGDLFIEGNRTKIGVLPLLQESLAASHDVFIINFGLWHGETRQPEYQENLHQLGQFYNSTKDKFPNLFWMETPKQHFDSADGDYKVGWIAQRKGPFVCQAVKGVTLNSNGQLTADENDAVAEYVVKGSWRNIMAREILVGRYSVPIMPVYNATATAQDFHRSNFNGQECSHYCHPSIPQLWLFTMKETFKTHNLQPISGSEIQQLNKRRKRGCASVYERDEAKLGAPKPLDLTLQQLSQQQQNMHSGFWHWLLQLLRFGRSLSEEQKVQIIDGVAIMLRSSTRAPPGSDGGLDSGPYSHSGTLHPWNGLQQLLQQHSEGQQLHRRHRRQQQQQGA